MTTAALLLDTYEGIIGNTRKLLERVPEDKADWAPHAKSMKMGKLAMHCATLPLFGYYIVEDPGMDMSNPTRPHASLVFTTRENALAELDKSAKLLHDAVAAASDAHLAELWPVSYGGQMLSNVARSQTIRGWCLNHLIHHSAQLGVYLRLLDIPVPGSYGPSADEPFGAGK